jgi:hypothetical protein
MVGTTDPDELFELTAHGSEDLIGDLYEACHRSKRRDVASSCFDRLSMTEQ